MKDGGGGVAKGNACPPGSFIIKIYLAAPLFSQVERRWNRELASVLLEQNPDTEVILPQDT
ncbi:MAG: hypothetical protein IH874_08915 [Candidatus Dadabacteria bacterium]|nr:hypothetical protein [Candidatus Dadabacteria bacterium]